MKRNESETKREPLITRTHTSAYVYNFFKVMNGTLEPLMENVERAEKVKQSELNKMSKEHGAQVIATCIEEKSELIGMHLEDFLAMAKPVVDGRLAE